MDLPPLERALDTLTDRARVVSRNLANANTPGYLRQDVPFFEVMKSTLAGAPPATTPVEQDRESPVRGDGNNTSPERELAALGSTTLMYRTVFQLTAKELSLFRTAVTEGRR